MPYRPQALADIKENKRKLYRKPEPSSISSSSSSSSFSSSSPPPISKPFNVYVLGIDSVSRSQSQRHLKKLRAYLLSKEINAIEYYAYNKVALNTNPNLAAMHTGWHLDTPGNIALWVERL